MTGVIVGAAIIGLAWVLFELDQRRILRDLDRRADERIDPVWEAFQQGHVWKVR